MNTTQSALNKALSTLKDDFAVIHYHNDLQTHLSGMERLPQVMESGDIQSITVNVDKAAAIEFISKLGGVSYDNTHWYDVISYVCDVIMT